jgi:F0F1-type ATP synthase membrane subunit b/b'
MFLLLIDSSIQLVPDGTLALHIILIVLMVFILNITLFKPINRILAEREQQTQGRLNETQLILKQIDLHLGKYEQTLRKTRAEGYQLMESQLAEVLQHRQRLLNSLRGELQVSTEKQKQSIETQVGQARSTLEEDSRRIAMEISRQILHRPTFR